MPTLVSVRPIAQISLELGGQALPERHFGNLTAATIESSSFLPDVCTLHFADPRFELFDFTPLKLGAALKVSLGGKTQGSQLERPVFDGEVTALEAEIDMAGVRRVVIRAFDRAHRLQRGRKTKTFLEQSDADIAGAVAQRHGLTVEASSTPRRPWVCQENLTDWEFLTQLAQRNGFVLAVAAKKLIFKQAPAHDGEKLDLNLGQDLFSFRGQLSTGEQVDEVEVRGWDPLQKREVVGSAQKARVQTAVGHASSGADTAKAAFGPARVTLTRQGVANVDEARRLAQAVLDEIGSAFATCEGVAAGDPRLRLGSEVTIGGVGTALDGKYLVTEVRHLYDASGYRNEFRATGMRSLDVLSLVSRREPALPQIWRGIVTNANDPSKRGRVKVKIPALGSDIETSWCRVAAPGGGKSRGVQFLPEVDDEVLLLGSTLDDLYVVGGLWNQVDLLADSSAIEGGKIVRRVVRSRTGHVITLDDSDGKPGITIEDSSGSNRIAIDTKKNGLEIKAAGDVKISAGGKLTIEAAQDVAIQSQQGGLTGQAATTLSLTARASAELSSTGSVAVKAPNVNIGP